MLIWVVIIYGICLGINLAIARFRPEWLRSSRRPRSVGESRCLYNARSPWLRCAVNPSGPCRCDQYQPRSDLDLFP